MTYEQYINQIKTSRENIKDIHNAQQRHHIIPRCIGGTDEDDNLIWLYPRQHYEAHRLLAIQNKENKKLQTAFIMMSNFLHIKSGEQYQEAKKIAHKIYSDNMRNTLQKIWQDEQFVQAHKERMQKRMKQLWKDENFVEIHTKKKWEDPQQKQRMLSNLRVKKRKRYGQENSNARRVRNIQTGLQFNTINEAAQWCGIRQPGSIGQQIKGERGSVGKLPGTNKPLHWEYVDINIEKTGNVTDTLGAPGIGVFCMQKNQAFKSIRQACSLTGHPQRGIKQCCEGAKDYTSKDGIIYHWKYN